MINNDNKKSTFQSNGFDIQRVKVDMLQVKSAFGILLVTNDLLGSLFISPKKLDPVFHQISHDGKINELKQGIMEFLNEDYDKYEIGFPINLSYPSNEINDYVPLNRTGQTSRQLATSLLQIIQNAHSPLDIGKIIAAEIANNDVTCQLDTQTMFLCQDLRAYGYWNNEKKDSTFLTSSERLRISVLDKIVVDLLNLLLSGRVSFSVGLLQGPDNRRNEYGFVLYANITNHQITNLADIAGHHKINGPTNYVRIVFRFMDRIRSYYDRFETQNLQLNIIAMFPEDSHSSRLAQSILPSGIYPSSHIVYLGACPNDGVVDDRIPPVAPISRWRYFNFF